MLRFAAFHGGSITSKLIRFVTRSQGYSHIAVLLPQGNLIECWPYDGNRWQAWGYSHLKNHTPGTRWEEWKIEVDQECYDNCMAFYHYLAENKIKYDWTGVAGFVFKMTSGDRERRFCSEGCIEPLAKWKGWWAIVPAHVSPQDFINLIQAGGGQIVEMRWT